MQPAGWVVSVCGVNLSPIGGGEVFARALSSRLAGHGCESSFCHESLPGGEVRPFHEDSALRARMRSAARLAAERKFDLKSNLDTLMHAYGFE